MIRHKREQNLQILHHLLVFTLNESYNVNSNRKILLFESTFVLSLDYQPDCTVVQRSLKLASLAAMN